MKRRTVLELLSQLDAIESDACALEREYGDALAKVHPSFERSARNLLHYRALRRHDIRGLQKKLGHLGMSRLAQAEGHVLASLQAAKGFLRSTLEEHEGDAFPNRGSRPVTIKQARKLLNRNTKALLGHRSKGRRVRIMVTLPGHAASDEDFLGGLMAAGMNAARINCAHDDPDTWLEMIEQVDRARTTHRRDVRVCMDLGGPKIRTGKIRPGPQVVRYRPERDMLGQLEAPASVCLVAESEPYPLLEEGVFLPVPDAWLETLAAGDDVEFEDGRGKRRSMRIVGGEGGRRWARALEGAYLRTGTLLRRKGVDEAPVPLGDLPPRELRILLEQGDILHLLRAPVDGGPAEYAEDGTLLRPAHIACTAPEAFDDVEVGHRVLFDDGKIGGRVREVTAEGLVVEIDYAKHGGGKLAADKGINFPDSRLRQRGLTRKDRTDLAFVARHADVVDMSFVNTPSDVEDLLDAIEAEEALDRLGVILKIETRQAFDRLTDILLTGMRTYPLGVMIARGDLAIEVGWKHMARIQEEILSLCAAAHVPDIWATQVLERLAKKGLPSRAEITDAGMSQRAECVMLNKGHYIVQAIRLLDEILRDMQEFRDRKAPMLPALEVGGSTPVPEVTSTPS